jgi:signal transduction histidine kinase
MGWTGRSWRERWAAARGVLRARPVLADALLAAGLYLAENVLWLIGPDVFWPSNWTLALLWSLLGMAGVVVRRRFPWLAVGLVAVHTLVSVLGGTTEGLALIVVTYTAAAYLSARPGAIAAVLLWAPGIALTAAVGRNDDPPLGLNLSYFLAFNVMAALVCYLVGRMVYTRRRYVAALEERARSAEQNQRSLTERAVAEERRRIARELHDMVAHHVSVMGVLASGSRRSLGRDPDAVGEALATIEETSRTALREMRRLLDVLRTDPEPVGELAPQPGLAGLEPLIEQVREAGLPVHLHTSGSVHGLEPGVSLAVYRIVQEALTNALKHGGARTSAEVRLDVDDRWIIVEVFDTGRGPVPRPGPIGHGLLGMQERVALYGGTLSTGPRPGGGFRVCARIPVEEIVSVAP